MAANRKGSKWEIDRSVSHNAEGAQNNLKPSTDTTNREARVKHLEGLSHNGENGSRRECSSKRCFHLACNTQSDIADLPLTWISSPQGFSLGSALLQSLLRKSYALDWEHVPQLELGLGAIVQTIGKG